MKIVGKLLSFIITMLVFVTTSVQGETRYTKTFYINDALGSPVMAMDQAGNVIWREAYQPFGKRIFKQDSAKGNRRWYTGKPYDEDLGLMYFGARYYDPIVGRFMGVDPIPFQEGSVNSFNPYMYGNNNPYRFVDPDGRVPVIPIGIFILKEVAGEAFEQTTGLPAPTVKGIGKKVLKQVTKKATKGAEAAADAALAAGKKRGAAAQLDVNGKTFTDISGAKSNLHPDLQKALDNVPQSQRAPWHGKCAEIGCINQVLQSGVNPSGGTMRAVNIGKSGAGHRTPKAACSTCSNVADQFGVNH